MFAWKNMDDRHSLLTKLKMEMVYRDLERETALQQFMEITQPVLPVTEPEPVKEPPKEPVKESPKEKPKPKKKVIKAALPKSTK
jgi:hypothetical protein